METTANTELKEAPMQKEIKEVVGSIYNVLIEKNKRYGNAALAPASVFSKLSAEEAILVRLDDKLKRIMNSTELRKNDVFDVLGYLTLLSIQKGWTFEDLID